MKLNKDRFKDTDGTNLLPYIIGSYTIGIACIGWCIKKIREI